MNHYPNQCYHSRGVLFLQRSRLQRALSQEYTSLQILHLQAYLDLPAGSVMASVRPSKSLPRLACHDRFRGCRHFA
jgi:hypothetical protein